MAEIYDIGTKIVYNGEKEDIIIRNALGYIIGGKVLDFSDYTEDFVKAGHIIIYDGENTYKPMPVEGEEYGTLPDGYRYVGINVHAIDVKCPDVASILTIGEVNDEALPYAIDDIKESFQAEVKIDFAHDF